MKYISVQQTEYQKRRGDFHAFSVIFLSVIRHRSYAGACFLLAFNV